MSMSAARWYLSVSVVLEWCVKGRDGVCTFKQVVIKADHQSEIRGIRRTSYQPSLQPESNIATYRYTICQRKEK